jgi:hypothetical protein
MKKILLITLLALFNSLSKEKQCIVCICEKDNQTIISDPFCNYENPTLAIHKFTQKTLCKKDADILCKKHCEQQKCNHINTKIWKSEN